MKTLTEPARRALQYVANTDGNATIANFDEDHEPIGPQLRAELFSDYVFTASGKMLVTREGLAVLNGASQGRKSVITVRVTSADMDISIALSSIDDVEMLDKIVAKIRKQLTPETVPAHLRDNAPYKQCSNCGRKSWEMPTVRTECGMLQPNGKYCAGQMLPPDAPL